MSDTLTATLLARLEAAASTAPVPVEIPPRVFKFLGGHFTDFDEADARLVGRFPVRAEYRNPVGFMQGGIIIATMDNVMGPLCFLCGFFGVSTQINTAFVRPVPPDAEWIEVESRILARTANVAQLTAEARNEAGKTVALCQATFTIMHNRGA